jgi:predicted MFS family arabinose efflux permease
MRVAHPGGGVGRRLVLLLALTSGAAVATMYYAQPLLHTLAKAFGVSTTTAGLLVTVSQIGYVLGLAFVVPLGDLMERRRLIVISIVLVAVGEGVQAVTPNFGLFAAALFLTAIASCVAQVIVPLVSYLAVEDQRGAAVGTVMSGLLFGILLARTVSGLIASAFGWRMVFALAGLLVLALAAVLWRALPVVPRTSELPYRQALRSVASLARTEPLLRQRMVLGACAMGCFSVLWTALTFLLSGEHGSPYHYGNAAIGLFGLAGVAGAAAAQFSGRLADHGHLQIATGGGLVALLVSWVLLALGAHSLLALIAGIVVLDLGVQGLHISNQAAIYTLHPEARSRLTTAYMVAYFLGGVILSALTSVLYATYGWHTVCLLGAATALLAVAAWALTARRV